MPTKTKMPVAATVDEYIKRQPVELQQILQKVRKTIKSAAPKADEVISYAIPGYKYQGMLIFFAGWTSHISIYPAPWGAKELQKEMSKYEGSKGTIKFPTDQPIPYPLITKMVKYRLKENIDKANAKNLAKKKTS